MRYGVNVPVLHHRSGDGRLHAVEQRRNGFAAAQVKAVTLFHQGAQEGGIISRINVLRVAGKKACQIIRAVCEDIVLIGDHDACFLLEVPHARRIGPLQIGADFQGHICRRVADAADQQTVSGGKQILPGAVHRGGGFRRGHPHGRIAHERRSVVLSDTVDAAMADQQQGLLRCVPSQPRRVAVLWQRN